MTGFALGRSRLWLFAIFKFHQTCVVPAHPIPFLVGTGRRVRRPFFWSLLLGQILEYVFRKHRAALVLSRVFACR